MLKNRGAFIVRLHETLVILQQEGKESIAGWSQDGKSFIIYDPSTFLSSIFSSYFDSLTFSTFEQKLKSWGFLREPMYYSEGKVSYSHPFFARDKKPEIVRTPKRMLVSSANICALVSCNFASILLMFCLTPFPRLSHLGLTTVFL
jgi:hypothetical protein